MIVNAQNIWNTSRTPGTPFTFSAHIQIPTLRVYYQPSTVEILKYGWIQYLSYFILLACFAYPFWAFLIRHQIIETHMAIDHMPVSNGIKHYPF